MLSQYIVPSFSFSDLQDQVLIVKKLRKQPVILISSKCIIVNTESCNRWMKMSKVLLCSKAIKC